MSDPTPIKFLYQICTYTNCHPPLDFETLNLATANNHIFYVCIVICLTVAQFVLSTYGRCAILQMEFSMLIADTFANMALCACTIITCVLCYCIGNKYMNKLILLHAKVDLIEKRGEQSKARERSANAETNEEQDGGYASNVKITKTKQKQSYKNNKEFLAIVLVHIALISLITLDIYVTLYKFYPKAIYFYFFKYVQFYFVTTQMLYTIFAMKQIRRLIEFIMKTLMHQINSFLILPTAEMRESSNGLFTVTGWTRTALNTKADVKDVASVVVASQKYKDIYLLCYYYNAIYGWPLLLAMGVVLFEIIQAMNFVVQYQQHHVVNTIWMLCLKIFTAGYFYILQTWMILCCDRVTEEVTTFANIIYKQILVMSEARTLAEKLVFGELISLWYHISNNKPEFHAGFVKLGRKFIYGSFIGISSFIAVIVEFNRVINNHHGQRDD